MDFLFFIGRAHELAFAESQAVLVARYPSATIVPLTDQIALVAHLEPSQAVDLQALLGGTVKIAQVDETLGETDTPTLEKKCAELLQSLAEEKIAFGIAELGRDTLPAIDHNRVKEHLKADGLSVRFVKGVRDGLSASVLLHQDVDECVVVRNQGKIYLGHTIAVQNIDQWTVRDREKPAVDVKHGMLPPKVGRMLVNLALPGEVDHSRLLDPFCGTGTVVMEALMRGIEGIGSDLRIEAVGQTQKNCEWLVGHYTLTTPFRAVVSDATHITTEFLGGKVNAISAEGYLGELTPRPGAVPNLFRGLEKLYLGAFKQWTKVLEPGSRVAIALPRIEIKKTVYSLSPLVDRLKEHGYNLLLPPMVYDREGAVTQREVFVLQYK